MTTKLFGTWSNVQSKGSSITSEDVDMEVRFWSYIDSYNIIAAFSWLIRADLRNLIPKTRVDVLCEECCKLEEKLRDVVPPPSTFNITPMPMAVVWPS